MPRVVRIVGPALLLVVALVSAVAALSFGGGAAAEPYADPGEVVRVGLPIARLVHNIGAAGTIGALVLAAFALSREKPEYGLALDIAAAAAAVWTVAAAAAGFFSFLTLYLQPVTFDDRFGDVLARYLTQSEIGQAWLATVLIAATLTVTCFAVRNQTLVLFMAIGGVLGLIPNALQGHAGGTESHDAATSAIWVHVVFAAIWLGGLLTLALSARSLAAGRIVPLITRYSSLAIVSFVAVAVSGYVSAEIRVGTLGNLLTPYGLLVLVKVAALVALGVFGAVQRRYLIGRIQARGPRPFFWWLVASELAFMGLASGVAAALGRTATPLLEVAAAATDTATPAAVLTGAPLPPPVTFERLATLWNFDVLWVLFCAFGIFFYLAGVWRLRRRGDKWPVLRSVLWVLGLALLFYITNGGVNVYEKYVFSIHMLAHMALGMMVPLLLVPAAPITLALRAIRKRDDGSRGTREWIMLAVRSRYFETLSNPIIAAGLFVASLWIFYYTPLFRWATVDHVGHQWMIIHFLLTGYLFVQSLIGVDPSPGRAPYPMRLLVLLATMAFHAFFGLSLITGNGLLLADWYGAMGWGTDALADQQVGGGIAWSVGEIPTVILALAVAIMWARNDDRDSKRYDRKADRDGDAELEAYNSMLAARAATRIRR